MDTEINMHGLPLPLEAAVTKVNKLIASEALKSILEDKPISVALIQVVAALRRTNTELRQIKEARRLPKDPKGVSKPVLDLVTDSREYAHMPCLDALHKK